jgi:hypothetical protein
MDHWVRRLLFFVLALAGLWVLRRMLIDRAESGRWRWPGPPKLGDGGHVPALPPVPAVRDLDALHTERQTDAPVGGRGPGAGTRPPAPIATQPEPIPSPAEPAPGETSPGPVTQDPAEPAPAETETVEATPAEPASPETEAPAEPGPAANLDRVRERLASIRIDPPTREGTGSLEVDAATPSRRPRHSDRWQEPAPDGTCDQSYPVKVKMRSMLFHLPGMIAYDRTMADRCYRSAADAEADGFTRAKR